MKMDKRIRKRGIKASREKLEIAMLNAGIKTQASLAEKIAEMENLLSPPKDTINRVFREEYVSPKTITRIAKVLIVEPGSLYLTNSSDTGTNTNKSDTKPKKPILGKFSLVLNTISAELTDLTKSIHNQLKDSFKSIIINPSLLPEKYMSVDIAQKYQADCVLTIRSQRKKRYQAIQIFLYFKSIEQLIFTDSVTTVELIQRPDKIAQRFMTFKSSICEQSLDSIQSKFVSIDAQEKYLQARQLLDEHHSETGLKRAQNLLIKTLKSSPEFARAHAALANSYICECWRSDTKDMLEEAQLACDKAQQLDPQDSYVISVQSHLFRVTGRIPESIELCEKILRAESNNIDAVSGLAGAYSEAFSQGITDIKDAESQALFYARKAIEIEPDYWKHHFELGNNLFLTGNPLEALQAYEESAALNPNEITYINLGVMNLCRNKLDKAREFFNKARLLKPESYLGYEFLGYIFYYLGDYEQSIDYRKKALESFADKENIAIHEMWGALADAYRQAGNQQKAIENYAAAINIIERDKLQGYKNINNKICHYYYYYFMTMYQPDQYPVDYLQHISTQLSEFLDHELNPSTYVRLAHLFFIQDQLELSKKAIEIATGICPVFFRHPDLKPLLNPLEISVPEQLISS